MKVKELLELLADVNPDADVILQKDPEGNAYLPLWGVDSDSVYIPEKGSRGGDVFSMHWTAEEADMTPSKWAKVKKTPKCVVLFP